VALSEPRGLPGAQSGVSTRRADASLARVKSGRIRRDPLATAQISGEGQRPRPKAESKITDATERLLQDVRASDLKIEEILAEAEVSRRTFYGYFASKYAVITSLALRTLGEAYSESEPFFTGSTPAEQRAALRAGISRACTVWAEHRVILRAVVEHWQDVPELHAIWLDVIDRFTEGMATEIDDQRARGLVPDRVESQRVAQMLIWSGAYTIYLAGLPESKHIPDEHSVVELLVDGWYGAVYGSDQS
jgi:TetR/AcrR family transcriptional regulator, ethionamide resistance regulator